MTTDDYARSLVIASNYRVPDPARVPPVLEQGRPRLVEMGAHHVVVHASTVDQGRVLVTIAVQNREPIIDLLRSRVFFDWFDAVGVKDIPAVFAGEIIERIDVTDSSDTVLPGVVVAAITSVHDVPTMTERVRRAADRFAAAGVQKTLIFRAFDDPHEVMILQELDNEEDARRWVENPDPSAEWMEGAGIGAYPPIFVGRFMYIMRIDEAS